jgi:FADH2 O2-dependent halogenase
MSPFWALVSKGAAWHHPGLQGIKTNFGFMIHHTGQHQRPEEAIQLVIPPYREGSEAHLFRQDTDSYLTYTETHHGATVKYHTRVKNVDRDSKGVSLETDKGETIRARFIADASGGGHVLSRMWNLRDDPIR